MRDAISLPIARYNSITPQHEPRKRRTLYAEEALRASRRSLRLWNPILSHVPSRNLHQTKRVHKPRQPQSETAQQDRETLLPFEGDTTSYDSRFFRRNSLSSPTTQESSDDLLSARSPRTSTLTEIERETFERLFKSLREKPKPKSGSNKAKGLIAEATKSDEGEQERIQRFSDDEIYDAGTDTAELDGYIHTSSRSDPSSRLSSYPAELQGMAAKAETQMARDRYRQKLQEQSQSPMTDASYQEQRKVWMKIEDKLYNARTDQAIWEVIKWEIFARLKEIHEKAVATTKAHEAEEEGISKAPRKEKKQPKKRKLPPIPLSGYAPLMLLTIKLLARRTSYTPLAGSLVHLMRSHSRTAYVLCASTAFYNELIEHNFRLYHSITGVISLIREMSDSSFVGDGQTLITLDEITRYRVQALRGDYGEGVKALEMLPGKEGAWDELEHWKERFRSEMEQRAFEGARRAEVERQMREQGVLGDEEEEEEEEEEEDEDFAVAGSG